MISDKFVLDEFVLYIKGGQTARDRHQDSEPLHCRWETARAEVYAVGQGYSSRVDGTRGRRAA